MAKTTKQTFAKLVKAELGGTLTHEIRQLIDAAVRKQFDIQQFTERLVNTHYFRQKFPGIIEKNGTIANALSGQEGQGVSASALGAAIRNYRQAVDQFETISKQYNQPFDKQMLAHALQHNISAKEFQTRLQAIDTIDSNPEMLAAYKEQLRLAGIKGNAQDIYRAASGAGSRAFNDIYAATQFQGSLGLGAAESKALTKGLTGGTTTQTIDQIVQFARQNLQSIGPELANQGINPAQLVKILGNPTAYPNEIDQLGAIAQQRKDLYGRPVVGSYGQRGPGGGLQTYDQQAAAAY